ncbi:TPA: hypothetical protein KP562_002649 [Clostridioides difficile]|uniref:hypothetical protein n=1 Tax=Clostridioides sp. GD02404 TaxID=3054354 RepID=UPI001C1B66C9|nr:hypothetical protein [Clostridioides difficile]
MEILNITLSPKEIEIYLMWTKLEEIKAFDVELYNKIADTINELYEKQQERENK